MESTPASFGQLKNHPPPLLHSPTKPRLILTPNRAVSVLACEAAQRVHYLGDSPGSSGTRQVRSKLLMLGKLTVRSMSMALVFQYGSNATKARLNGPRRLNGHAADRGLACTVVGFDIAFDVMSNNNGCAACDLVPVEGRVAWGILYDI